MGGGRVLTAGRGGGGVANALVRTVAGYCLLVWLYLCVNSITHPYTISTRLTHFAAVPTEGATAVACFLLSLAAFLTVRLRVHRAPEAT